MTFTRLVLFDIDGTLLTTGGAGRESLRVALEKVYGTSGSIYCYDMGGRTIREIVRDLLTRAGVSQEEIAESFETFRVIWPQEMKLLIPYYDVCAFPGARELVEALAARDDTLPGLLTANIEATALLKLESAGFDPTLFRVQVFGDRSDVRSDLVPIAVEQAARLAGVDFAPQQVVLVGDSPLDIRCAHWVGARSIAVLTGGVRRALLEAAKPDFLFGDLTDGDAIVQAILG